MTSPSSPEATDVWNVPFFYFIDHPRSSDSSDDARHQNENNYQHPSFRELQTSLRNYREMADGVIRKLSSSHEVARRTEQTLFPHHDHSCRCTDASVSFLSCRLEEKISKSANLLEQNTIVLESLLRPFPVNIVRHSTVDALSNSRHASLSNTNTHFTFPPPISNSNDCQASPDHSIQLTLARYIPPYKPSQRIDAQHDDDEAPYDSASHILTHLVRDWTASGDTIRKDTHAWILDQLLRLHANFNSAEKDIEQDPSHGVRQRSISPVLVPGAGLARLAFDIAFARAESCETNNLQCYPFAVEAVDNSIVMAAAAYQVLHYTYSIGQERDHYLEVFPFVADPLSNEVHSQQRWKSELFPENVVSRQLQHLDMQQSSNRPNLSYMIGDFVSVYASPNRHAMFGSIATCFFIDTATNIYEYIMTIRNLLRVGGVWINVGPLQWHRNSQLQPSVDELKEIISLSRFEIRHWEISDKLLAYRHPDDILLATRAEAYRPLKFVVVLQPDDSEKDEAMTAAGKDDLTSTMNRLRQVTGRRSC